MSAQAGGLWNQIIFPTYGIRITFTYSKWSLKAGVSSRQRFYIILVYSHIYLCPFLEIEMTSGKCHH